MENGARPWADPQHPGNKLRPRVRCIGCGKRGCVTQWGPWCMACNVPRLDRISVTLARLRMLLDCTYGKP